MLLSEASSAFKAELTKSLGVPANDIGAKVPVNGKNYEIGHGDVVIAAITSCTNTSNPYVMVAAGLVARKARALGLRPQPWVKTSLAPGSQVVTEYLDKSGLHEDLDAMGFALVGYGCTTCIGNSGPLEPAIGEAIDQNKLVAVSVLSGNRNFEGRVHPQVRANYLASPPLVVAYALLGTMNEDITTAPLGTGSDGQPVFLKDVWPTNDEIAAIVPGDLTRAQFLKRYGEVFVGPEEWQKIEVEGGTETYGWTDGSTYVKNPPYFEGMTMEPVAKGDIVGARVLGLFGDNITTDHISPAGNIKKSSPAGEYLVERQVSQRDFNSYGARRGNHEVMMRGTFANIRIKNEMLAGVEGGLTKHYPDGARDADLRRRHGVPEGRRAAGGVRRQGIRHGLVARLGGEGHHAAGHQGRAGRELRAHPPLQPGGHGRPAADPAGGRDPAVAEPDRGRGDRRHRDRDDHAAHDGAGDDPSRRRHDARRCRRCAGSIPTTRSSTTATAASCNTCCAGWPRRPERLRRARALSRSGGGAGLPVAG